MKTCNKCKQEKEIEFFGKNKNLSEGLATWCKACLAQNSRNYYVKNRETVLEKDKVYYQENKERLKSEALRRRQANLKRAQERCRQYKAANREKIMAYQKAYVKANLDKFNCYNNNRRARLLSNGGGHTSEEWNMLCESYGMICLACKEEKPLTRDHIVPISKGGTNDIWNIQPLCQRCNSRKGANMKDYRLEFSL